MQKSMISNQNKIALRFSVNVLMLITVLVIWTTIVHMVG